MENELRDIQQFKDTLWEVKTYLHFLRNKYSNVYLFTSYDKLCELLEELDKAENKSF